MADYIMFGRRSPERGRRWRAGVAGATVSLMVLLAALAGARDGWHLNLSIDNERVNSVPNLAAALNSREGFVTLSATATATGGMLAQELGDQAIFSRLDVTSEHDWADTLAAADDAFGPVSVLIRRIPASLL